MPQSIRRIRANSPTATGLPDPGAGRIKNSPTTMTNATPKETVGGTGSQHTRTTRLRRATAFETNTNNRRTRSSKPSVRGRATDQKPPTTPVWSQHNRAVASPLLLCGVAVSFGREGIDLHTGRHNQHHTGKANPTQGQQNQTDCGSIHAVCHQAIRKRM